MKRFMGYKKMAAVMLAGALVLSVAGCSKEETAAAKTDTASPSASTEDAVTIVKVGTGNGAAPFCYLDEDGNSVGYDLDVLHELDTRLDDYDFDIEAMDFSTLIVSIDSGNIDMLSHQLVKSSARKEKYLFPDQYYSLSPMSLCVKEDSGIAGMSDMAGKSIEQNPSAYEYGMLLAYNEAHPGGELEIRAVSDQTTADGYKKVSNGQVDAALTYQATYATVVDQIGISNLELTDVVMVEDTYMMLPQGNEDLRDAVDAGLKSMIDDGTLSEISQKWFDEDVFTNYADMVTIVAE